MSKRVAGKPGLDPILPNVSLTLNGITYQLCFDFNAIATVEAETGINLFASDQSKFSPVNFRAMLYASVIKAHPDMTLDQAGGRVLTGGRLRMIRWFVATSNIFVKCLTKCIEGIKTEAFWKVFGVGFLLWLISHFAPGLGLIAKHIFLP